MSDMQKEFVNQLVYVIAEGWSGPMPADLPHMDSIHERVTGAVHSLIVNLEGFGGIQPHRLSPKHIPNLDLLGQSWSLRYPVPEGDSQELIAARLFMQGIDDAVVEAEALAAVYNLPHRQVLDHFLAAVCRSIEEGYVLVPQFYDEDGEPESEGDDIAPGLAAVFAARTATA